MEQTNKLSGKAQFKALQYLLSATILVDQADSQRVKGQDDSMLRVVIEEKLQFIAEAITGRRALLCAEDVEAETITFDDGRVGELLIAHSEQAVEILRLRSLDNSEFESESVALVGELMRAFDLINTHQHPIIHEDEEAWEHVMDARERALAEIERRASRLVLALTGKRLILERRQIDETEDIRLTASA